MAVETAQRSVRKHRKIRVGVVTSARKTPKTITVDIGYHVRHPMYGKYVRRRERLHAHDPESVANIGDRVEVMECRRISKTKSWRLVKVLEQAPQD